MIPDTSQEGTVPLRGREETGRAAVQVCVDFCGVWLGDAPDERREHLL